MLGINAILKRTPKRFFFETKQIKKARDCWFRSIKQTKTTSLHCSRHFYKIITTLQHFTTQYNLGSNFRSILSPCVYHLEGCICDPINNCACRWHCLTTTSLHFDTDTSGKHRTCHLTRETRIQCHYDFYRLFATSVESCVEQWKQRT